MDPDPARHARLDDDIRIAVTKVNTLRNQRDAREQGLSYDPVLGAIEADLHMAEGELGRARDALEAYFGRG